MSDCGSDYGFLRSGPCVLPLSQYALPIPVPAIVVPIPAPQAGPAQSPLMPLFGTLMSVPSLTISYQIITLPTSYFINYTFLSSIVINIYMPFFYYYFCSNILKDSKHTITALPLYNIQILYNVNIQLVNIIAQIIYCLSYFYTILIQLRG